MMTPKTVLDYVRAEPFRPFQVHMACGKTFDIRHPEMVKVLKSYLIVFHSTGGELDVPDEFETASLMLAESISHLEVPAT